MLRSERVILRPWQEADVAALLELRNDFALQSMLMTQPRPNTVERVRAWLTGKSSTPNVLFFVIEDVATGSACGYIQAVDLDTLNGTCTCGVCIRPSEHGSGIGREALTLLEAYLHGTFAIRKIVVQVLGRNARARRFFGGRGFHEVGTLRQHFLHDGALEDVVLLEKFLSP